MTATTANKPVGDLMYDWLTVLKNKAEGVAAYDQYLRDAEEEHATECAAMFKKLRERDRQTLEEVRDHVFRMIIKYHSGT